MLEVTEINKELLEASRRLQNGSKKIFSLAKNKAEAEQKYRRALAVEILTLRDLKIQATLIPDIARGNTSELKFKRDLAEAEYTSARDSLEAIQVQISALQSILKYQEEV